LRYTETWRPQRGKVLRQIVGDDLKQVLGPVEVLEPVLAEIPST
jgi:hypothetical protein